METFTIKRMNERTSFLRESQNAVYESLSELPDYFIPSFSNKLRKSSHFQSVFKIISTLIDGTSLSLPYAFAKMGFGISLLVVALVAFTTYFTLTCILTLSKKLNAASYSDIVDKVHGIQSRRFLTLNLLFILISSLVGFEILVKSMLKDVLKYFIPKAEIWLFEIVTALIIFAVIFPLTLVESLHSLRHSCLLGFISMLLVLGSLVYKLFTNYTSTLLENSYLLSIFSLDVSRVDLSTGVPIIFLVYFCHFNVLGVYTQLQNPTEESINRVVRDALFIITVIYIVMGYVGCCLIPLDSEPPDNILLIFSSSDTMMMVGRSALLITLLCAIPVIVLPLRTILLVEFIGSMHCLRVFTSYFTDQTADSCRDINAANSNSRGENSNDHEIFLGSSRHIDFQGTIMYTSSQFCELSLSLTLVLSITQKKVRKTE